MARPIMENVFEMVKNTSYSVVLTDEKGVIIDLIINKDLEEKHVLLNFVKGSKWDEQSVGTNAIGTCLAINEKSSERWVLYWSSTFNSGTSTRKTCKLWRHAFAKPLLFTTGMV